MAHTRFRRAALGCSLALVAFFSCKGDEPVNRLTDFDPHGGSSGVLLGTGGSGGSAGTGAPRDAGADASGAPSNCGELACRGAGKCVVEDEVAKCVCDPGYILQEGECVVDETCINLRLLERGCRQRTAAEPALGMFFGVETCAGTNVRSDILGPPETAFKVLEDSNALGDESYVALFPREVEPFVAIALDLSGSLQRDQGTLIAVIAQLKQMVQGLESAPGTPPVRVELIVFGRTVDKAQEFTQDLSQVVATLDAIQANPAGAVRDPNGTNLFGAVNTGISYLDEAMNERHLESGGAVVSTGTLVTITDGRDSSGGVVLAPIPKRFNAISIGISGDIDDEELTRIGPQGSFLAPTQPDWASAFNRVVARVLDYPKRSYLLGYCSPAVAGSHKVSVTLAGRKANADASCTLNAADFGVGAGACNASFLGGYCGTRSCGSFLACGACQRDAGAAQNPDDYWKFTLGN